MADNGKLVVDYTRDSENGDMSSVPAVRRQYVQMVIRIRKETSTDSRLILSPHTSTGKTIQSRKRNTVAFGPGLRKSNTQPASRAQKDTSQFSMSTSQIQGVFEDIFDLVVSKQQSSSAMTHSNEPVNIKPSDVNSLDVLLSILEKLQENSERVMGGRSKYQGIEYSDETQSSMVSASTSILLLLQRLDQDSSVWRLCIPNRRYPASGRLPASHARQNRFSDLDIRLGDVVVSVAQGTRAEDMFQFDCCPASPSVRATLHSGSRFTDQLREPIWRVATVSPATLNYLHSPRAEGYVDELNAVDWSEEHIDPGRLDSARASPGHQKSGSRLINLVGSRRNRDDPSHPESQAEKRRRITGENDNSKPATRFACLYNKYDPMMYRSNDRTGKKFEICETRDFQNMNKLYEHLKRVHSDQPMQCPRCIRTDFNSSDELQAHQTATTPCNLVPTSNRKRILWMSENARLSLQADITRNLRGCKDEDKWKFAYRLLFPESSHTPSPYLQDPTVSIVSSVFHHLESCLRKSKRQSHDMHDFENQIPTIREQFLAQYGMKMNESENISSPSSSLSSSPERMPDISHNRSAAIPPLEMSEHVASGSRIDDVTDQAIPFSEPGTFGNFLLPEHSDALIPSTSDYAHSLMPTTQSERQLSRSIPTHGHDSLMNTNTPTRLAATQPQNQSIQTASESQYQPVNHDLQTIPHQNASPGLSFLISNDFDWLQSSDPQNSMDHMLDWDLDHGIWDLNHGPVSGIVDELDVPETWEVPATMLGCADA